MKISNKYFRAVIGSIKLLLGAASTASLIFSSAPAHAAPQGSPLLSQSEQSQASVSQTAEAIKNAAGGQVTADNIESAIKEVVSANPDLTADQLAAALNQLGLPDEALAASVEASASAYSVGQDKVAAAMISDAFMKGGKDAATAKIAELRRALGNKVVDNALENIPTGMLADASDLQNIEPAAGGVYEG